MIRKLKNLAHLILGWTAGLVYGFPARKITIIGVTGTDGKTTTTSLIYHILNYSGHKTAMITTVGAYLNGEEHRIGLHVTTPSAWTLQKFLRDAVRTGHKFAVIETSSHGIDQNRIAGIPYRVAVITNITHEHLDYHKSFEEYARVKFKLLKKASIAVINLDDAKISSLAPLLKNNIVTYSRLSNADYTPAKYPFKTKLFGSFNESNCLAAIASVKQFSIPDDQIKEALEVFKAPLGRQDIVYDKEFKVMVDFAHTPNSIENILREVKNTHPKRLIHLFGAPGHRDQDKRPMMGQASAQYADVIILTADDPREEKVENICAQIRKGISGAFEINKNLFEVYDRKEAIKMVISMAQPGDFIVLTGKGHEAGLALSGGDVPWNEREIVLEIIKGK